MADPGPVEFIRQVDEERRKVTWTPRQETIVTTIMVFIMVALAAVFFLGVDWIISTTVRFFLGLG